MLPRKNRIRTRFEFGKVKKFGDFYKYRYFYLYALPISRLEKISNGRWHVGGQTQVGFIISRKFHKNAVVRNKIKRFFRESVRQNLATIAGMQNGWWLVFHPRLICLGANYEKINAEVAEILQKLSFTRAIGDKNV